MKTIHKFALEHRNDQKIIMPKGAIIISAGAQGVQIVIWAFVETEEKEKEQRHFVIYATGQELEHPIDQLRFIDTVQIHPYVFHVFEGAL